MKIDSMRSTFRKERKKVLQSKETATKPEDVYKPSLWYYDLLLFTAGEDAESESMNDLKAEEVLSAGSNPEDGNSVKIPFWSREYSAILINFYKSYPCLYSMLHPHYKNKKKREDAVKKITEKLMEATGKYFHSSDVRRKISLIRGQFLYEYKKIKNSESKGDNYKPSLWCFDMLSFLHEEYANKNKIAVKKTERRMNLRPKIKRKNISSEDSDEDMNIKKESDSSLSSESIHPEIKETDDEDLFDTTGKSLARILREMTDEQRTFANKIIREVMYHGQMEHLTSSSRFSLDGS
ncbi:uncharacterized protein LOC123005850 isoform X2 [Tribolium madens]|nr:uncharacterized protein LOC123005850 isoform X2 [Tribolium madens]